MWTTWRNACYTALFLRDFVAGEKATWFKRLGGEVRVTRHSTTAPSRRAVPFDLYKASRRSSPGRALVVAHGFTHEGAQDPRLQSLCRRLARLGWAVVVPEFPQMRRYQLGLEDTEDLETVVECLTEVAGISADRIGILAFSFGAAPVLIGLSRDPVRARAGFALVFGGYFDLRHAIRYVLTGAYDLGGISGHVLLPAERDDRWKFLRGNLHLLPPSTTREAFTRMLEARIADPGCAVDESLFSDVEQVFFRLIDNRDPARFEEFFAPAAPYLDRWLQDLSPATVARSITTPLVVVHSTTDQKTHYSESLALSRAVVPHGDSFTALVNTFAHVDISLRCRSLAALKTELLPGLARMWRVGAVLVRGAGSSGVAFQATATLPRASSAANPT